MPPSDLHVGVLEALPELLELALVPGDDLAGDGFELRVVHGALSLLPGLVRRLEPESEALHERALPAPLVGQPLHLALGFLIPRVLGPNLHNVGRRDPPAPHERPLDVRLGGVQLRGHLLLSQLLRQGPLLREVVGEAVDDGLHFPNLGRIHGVLIIDDGLVLLEQPKLDVHELGDHGANHGAKGVVQGVLHGYSILVSDCILPLANISADRQEAALADNVDVLGGV
mmetsp:Transcript_18960/g.37933  ORF Transcript_18960/g.37933 Transcript_18960/m.37933 type:complete len:227 (+) Transcript_18960:99-779(+)